MRIVRIHVIGSRSLLSLPAALGGAALVVASTGLGSSSLAAATTESVPATSAVSSISGNWAGYVAEAQGVTAVTGAWTVPPAGTVPPGLSATWVGIGGATTTDLIQAGTQQSSPPLSNLVAGGSYSAWYELLPANPVYVTGCSGDANCTVNPGDQMNVDIANTGGNSWSIVMTDVGHWTDTIPVTYTSSESSAEWVHEAPSLLGVLPVPVGGSGTVAFDGNNTATIGGSVKDIAASGATATEALPVETTTSALDSDGDGFNVCTYALTCSPSAS